MASNKLSIKTILLEILIVIIGITIAFWLNNWGEERKERDLEMEFLKSLRTELATDSAAFAYQVGQNEKNLAGLNGFISLLRKKDYKNDSVTRFIGSFLNRNNWIINDNTFEVLKSGGKLDIISDFELRSDISAFYRIRTFQTERILEVIQHFMDNQMQVYLTKNSDYFISEQPDPAFVRDPEFQNLLVLWSELNDHKLGLYDQIIADITQLISKLDEHLE